jgi:hypothetical protein
MEDEHTIQPKEDFPTLTGEHNHWSSDLKSIPFKWGPRKGNIAVYIVATVLLPSQGGLSVSMISSLSESI